MTIASKTVCAIAVFSLTLPCLAHAQDARITVLTILATDRNDSVDPKLKSLAREIQVNERSLTGFRLGKTTSKELSVGEKKVLALFDDENKAGFSADVKLVAKNDSKKTVEIEVKPPTIGAITYSIKYDKFFPIVTRAVVDGERLIIAVMVKPAK